MAAFEGVEIEFGHQPNQYQTLNGTKVFYVDKSGNNIELNAVCAIGIPHTTVDDLLYITITLPLLNIKYKENR